jgi:hypothetical protein
LRLLTECRVKPFGALECARQRRGVLSLAAGDGNPPQEQRTDERIATEHQSFSVGRIILVIERNLSKYSG